MICRRVPASIFLFCSCATCSKAFTWRYLASIVGLLMTTSVSPALTHSPSSTRKESMRPGSFPLMRISVASICPCSTIGCRLISNIPMIDTTTVTIKITMNVMLIVLLLIFILYKYKVWSISLNFQFSFYQTVPVFRIAPAGSSVQHRTHNMPPDGPRVRLPACFRHLSLLCLWPCLR